MEQISIYELKEGVRDTAGTIYKDSSLLLRPKSVAFENVQRGREI